MPTRPPTHNPHGARPERERQRKRALDRRRGSSATRLYDRKWRKARLIYLAEHPLCMHCLAESATTPSTIVDHVEPHRGDPVTFWDQTNWQALCKSHHDAKTAREVASRREGGLKTSTAPPR